MILLLFVLVLAGGPARGQEPPPTPGEDPNQAMYLLNDAISEYANRRLYPARSRLEELIKRFPKHPLTRRARLELARVHKDLREFDKAVEILTAMVTEGKADAENGAARDMLLDLLFDLHRYKQGVDLLEGWWKDNPGDAETGRRLARFYLSSGRPDEAKVLLEGLLERTARPDVFGDLLNLAVKQAKVEELRSVIEQRKARYRTADYLDFITDCDLAIKADEKAAGRLREAPETATDLRLLRKLAQIDQARNDPAHALESLRLLQKMFPEQWEYAKAIGHCLFLQGKQADAVQEWRGHFQRRGNLGTEGFQLFTDVLIEHKLFEEALAAFEEARRLFGIPTQFAEEKAGVLEALGRKKEALEEYFLTLVNGLYKTEIFDKLYESRADDFHLKERLLKAYRTMPTLAVKRGLLEVWFREEELAALPELLSMAASDGNIQEIAFERIRQQTLARPTEFLRTLLLGLIRQDRASSLALRLTLILLTLPDQSTAQAEEALAEATQEVGQDECPDLSLKNLVLVEMARQVWERFSRAQPALGYLGQVTAGPAVEAIPGVAFDAWLLTMRIRAALGDLPGAGEALAKAQKLAARGEVPGPPKAPGRPFLPPPELDQISNLPMEVPPDDDGDGLFSAPDLGDEAQTRLLYEESWLMAQKGEYQEALDKLKLLTTDHPESLWMNDGLQLALLLTMGSVGDLDTLKKFLAAERAFLVGSGTEALEMMKSIAVNASGTFLGSDAEGRALLMAERTAEAKELLKEVDGFVRFHPAHALAPDLWMLKLRLMRRTGEPSAAIADHLKDFIDRFPGDLRSRRARLDLAELMRFKGQAEQLK